MEITEHAYERAKERCGLNKKAFNRMVDKAVLADIDISKTKNNLKKWINSCILPHKIKMKTLLYDKYMILHINDIVHTIYYIPRNLLPISKFLV